MSTTIRISEATRDRFAAMSRQTGRPMTELLDQAATAMERELFFSAFNEGYQRLRRDSAAWAEVIAERDAQSASLADSAD